VRGARLRRIQCRRSGGERGRAYPGAQQPCGLRTSGARRPTERGTSRRRPQGRAARCESARARARRRRHVEPEDRDRAHAGGRLRFALADVAGRTDGTLHVAPQCRDGAFVVTFERDIFRAERGRLAEAESGTGDDDETRKRAVMLSRVVANSASVGGSTFFPVRAVWAPSIGRGLDRAISGDSRLEERQEQGVRAARLRLRATSVCGPHQ
jgi:hypothetical protein